MKMKRLLSLVALILILSTFFTGCDIIDQFMGGTETPSVDLDSIPAFDGKHAYVIINDNVPFFTDDEKATKKSYETYGDLDALGRCTVAHSCIGFDLMPTETRGSIGQVKPSGWQTVKYDIVDGKYLYNRCHLIGYQLTGENANVKNLITGTRYLNIDGMLDFENMVADYVKDTKNHVMYRVTPIYDGNNLVASGVLMEGWSVEDNGDGICFCIYAYNAQPGISINYKNGNSWLSTETPPADDSNDDVDNEIRTDIYYLNVKTGKFHIVSCRYADGDNVVEYEGTLDDLLAEGKDPCGVCLKDLKNEITN